MMSTVANTMSQIGEAVQLPLPLNIKLAQLKIYIFQILSEKEPSSLTLLGLLANPKLPTNSKLASPTYSKT